MNKLKEWLLNEISVGLAIGILIVAVLGAIVMHAGIDIYLSRQWLQ